MRKSLILLLVFSLSLSIHAQHLWQNLPSLDSFPIYDFHPTEDGLLIAMSGGAIQKTTDEGATWRSIPFDGGLEGNTFFSDFAQIGNTIYVASRRRLSNQYGGIFKSNDDGETWQGAYDENLHKDVHALVSVGTRLVAGTKGGIFTSDNGGTTWTKAIFDKGEARYFWVHSMTTDGTTIIAGANSHIFLSQDGGDTWQSVRVLEESTTVIRAAYVNGRFYVATSGEGIHTSVDGLEWEKLELGIPENPSPNGKGGLNMNAFLMVGDNQYYSVAGNIYKNGEVMNEGFTMEFPSVRSFTIYKNVLYAGTYRDGVWKYALPTNETASVPKMNFQPNPSASNEVNLTYEVQEKGKVSILLYDQNGKQIQVIADEMQDVGTYQVKVDVRKLLNGNYYFHYRTKDHQETRSLVIAN